MNFKHFSFSIITFLALCFLMACGGTKNTNPNQLSAQTQDSFKYEIARYIHKLPNRATDSNKFESQFDEYYITKTKFTTLENYYKAVGDTIYFQVSKIAPSMKVKKVATAGKLLKDASGKIVYYEEMYRTWKMEEPELAKKGKILFDALITVKDLSPYYSENSGNEEYIEFPDKNNKYDPKQRVWVQFQ